MKKLLHLSLVSILFFLSANIKAQTIFWSDNFDAPAGGATYNNAGAGWSGSTATPGGGQNTSIFGVTDGWVIGTTNAPAGICVGTGSKLYVKASSGGSGNTYESDIYTDQYDATPNISTVGATNIKLVFSWRCNGVSGSDYGMVGFSANGGATWNWLPTQYQGESTCQANDTLVVPNTYSGITNFMIGYRFISNATSCTSCDPAFNIDNIELIGNVAAAGPPVTTFSVNDSTGCPGSCFTFTDNSTNSPTARRWTFTGGVPDTSTAASVTVCYASAGTYAVKLVSSNGSGPDSLTKASAILINAKPNAGGDQNICQYSTTAMTASGTGAWTQAAGNPAVVSFNNTTSATSTVSGFNAAGAYLFYWSKNGCSDTVAINVMARPNAGTDQTVCQYGTTALAASGNGSWSAAGGNPSAVTFANSSSATSSVSGFASSGTYLLLWSENGCSDTVNVNVIAKPNAGPDQSFCSSGTSTTMAATGVGTWTQSTGNPTVASITNTTSPATSVSGLNVAGVYSFYWSDNGCADTVNITVNAKPNAGTDQTLCQYESTTLAATGTGSWNVGASNPSIVGFSNTSSPTSTATGFDAAGSYQLYWSQNGCSDTVGIHVTAKPNAGNDQSICQFSTLTMAATGSGTWTANASNPAFTTINAITSATTTVTGFTQPGVYTYYWSLSGCIDTVEINVSAAPVASITSSGDTMTAQPAGASYQWIKNGALVPGVVSQVYIPMITGNYEVIVTEGSCNDTSSAYNYIYKPNGLNTVYDINVSIWPNPFNDHIEVRLGDMSSASIEIYNILGTKIINGTYHNQASIDMATVSAGVYLIHIKNDKIDTTRMITKQ